MPAYEVERITIEVVSAIMCFILLRYMIKPYNVTRENRYLGLPLGFAFLGASYAFSAISYSSIFNFSNWGWIQLFIRGFAFLFLAVTHYFSNSKPEKKPELLWNLTFIVIASMFTLLVLFAIISPQISQPDYVFYYIIVRALSLIFLFYIITHSLIRNVKKPNKTTLMTPLAFTFLAINQLSSIVWVVQRSYFALFGGVFVRLAGLVILLFITYKTFYGSEKKGK